jgi:hypothetical protein
MSVRSEQEARYETREENQSLWLLAAAPLFWAAHFLLSYITSAVFCAKFAGPAGSLFEVRIAIGIYTAVALLFIGLVARRAAHRHHLAGDAEPLDADSAAGRHRFLGFAALLLCALSAVATLYAGAVVLFFRSCD